MNFAAEVEPILTKAGCNSAVHELTFAAKLAASAGADRTVRLWNPQSGAQVRSLAAESPAFAVALDPAGRRVAAGCADGLVRVWDADGRQLLTPWAGDGWLALTPEGYYAASEGLVAVGAWRAGGRAGGRGVERPEARGEGRPRREAAGAGVQVG